MRPLTFIVVLNLLACQSPSVGDAGASGVSGSPRPVTALLRVEAQRDGTVLLIGNDRWGHALNAVYESPKYLRDAVPVLKRGLTDEQGAALETAVAALPR